MSAAEMGAISLGAVGSGPIARVAADGSIAETTRQSRLRWWVLAEDQLHRPEQAASVRQELVENMPVVVTRLHVPGGDVSVTSYVFVPPGGGDPAVAIEVHNDTPVPVAIAVAVEAPALRAADQGLAATEVGLAVSRRPAHWLAGPDFDAVADSLDTAAQDAPDATEGPVMAVVVPIPHTQVVRFVLGADGLEADAAPSSEQVVSGWHTQLEVGTRVEWSDATDAARWDRQRARLLMADWPAGVDGVADRLRAQLMCGWHDLAHPAGETLIGVQRWRGGLRAADPLMATIDALAGLSSWTVAGVAPEGLNGILGPVASMANWLVTQDEKGRVSDELRPRLVDALALSGQFFAVMGQTDAAVDAETWTRQPGWSEAADAGTPGETVGALIDAVVVEHRDVVDVIPGWRSAWNGQSFEAMEIPTSWGLLSVAVRWHGVRPALLWDLERWSDGRPLRPFRLTASGLDPAWSSDEASGEALLAPPTAPGSAEPAAPSGASFS